MRRHRRTTCTCRRGQALRLTIFVRTNDQWHHRPLHSEIVHRGAPGRLAGASVFHGIEGFGRVRDDPPSRILSLGDDPPSRS